MQKFVLAVMTAMAAGSLTANAQQLTPSDYSPSGDASIKTIKIKSSGRSKRAVVAIANYGSKPFNTNFACTLFDENSKPVGTTAGSANAVPPQQEVVAESMSFDEVAAKVACRIELIVPSR